LRTCWSRNDFSPAGAGLLLPDAITLPEESDMAFDHATGRCIPVWRRSRSAAGAKRLIGSSRAQDPAEIAQLRIVFLVCKSE
jgi:hypothetical protein